MDLTSSKQNLLRNLQELPNPSSSEALLLGRPSAVAATMTVQSKSNSRKHHLPSVLQPKAKAVEKTLEEAFELLQNSIVSKFTNSPLADRRISATLYDKDGVLLLANQFIEINARYSLPTLILALQTILDEVCTKNPRKYPNPLLVRAIEVRYFNDEKYAGLPRISAFLGGEEIDQDGKVAEFVQWKENMVEYWEIFKRVMLIRAEAVTIMVPILKVRTVEMVTDWDGPHGVEVVGNGHAFGDTLIPKQSPKPKTENLELAEHKEVENILKTVNNTEVIRDTATIRNNAEFLQSTTSQIQLSNAGDKNQGHDSDNVASASGSRRKEDVSTELDVLVANAQEKLEKIGNPHSITLDELGYAFKIGKSVISTGGWMAEAANEQYHFVKKDSPNLDKHVTMVRVGLEHAGINIKDGNEDFTTKRIKTWAYYQHMGGNSVMHNLFKLDHIPFVPRPAPVQGKTEGDTSVHMMPYSHITFEHLYPAELEGILRFQASNEAARNFDLEDDDTYIPDRRFSLINPFTIKPRNHKEVQAGLNKVLGGALHRKASAQYSAYLESISQGTASMFTPTGNNAAGSRVQGANTLSAKSSTFIPSMNTETQPENQMIPYNTFTATPTRQTTPYDRNTKNWSSNIAGAVNHPFSLPRGMSSLFTTQEDYDAYQRVAAAEANKLEHLPDSYEYSNFSTPTNSQGIGGYNATPFSNNQGLNAYNNMDGYLNNQQTNQYQMDPISRNYLGISHSDDWRGMGSNQNYMTSELSSSTPRSNSGHGYYREDMSLNQQQHGFNNIHSSIDFNSSLATAFNGNMNQTSHNLQVPNNQHRRTKSKSRRAPTPRSRNGSRARNNMVPQPNPATTQGKGKMLVAQDSLLRAESPSFAPEFKFTASMHQNFMNAPTAGQEEESFLFMGTGVTDTIQESDPEEPQQ